MEIKCRTDTCCKDIDREISDVLIAISVVARRAAEKIEKLNEERRK